MLVRLGRWPSLAPRDVDAVAVDYEISAANALIISLPVHAQAVAPAPRPGPTIAPPPGSKVNVIDKVVGAGPTPPKYATQSGVRK